MGFFTKLIACGQPPKDKPWWEIAKEREAVHASLGGRPATNDEIDKMREDSERRAKRYGYHSPTSRGH